MKKIKTKEPMSIGLQVIKIYIRHLCVHKDRTENIQRLALCCRALKKAVEEYYYAVKAIVITSNSMETTWMLIPRRVDAWRFNYPCSYSAACKYLSVTFIYGNIAFAHFCSYDMQWQTQVTPRFEFLGTKMSTNYKEFGYKEEDGTVNFTFTKKIN